MGTCLHRPCKEEGEKQDRYGTHSSSPHPANTPRLPLTRCPEGTLPPTGSCSCLLPWSHLSRAGAQEWTRHAPEMGMGAGPCQDQKS